MKSQLPQKEKYRNSGLPESLALKLIGDLEKLMDEEKLYRESNLNLSMLAQKLGSTYHFISQLINQYYQINFFEYVNRKRVEDAKIWLQHSGKMKVIEVAYRVGYSTKNTFNRAFKRLTGCTPTEYRNGTMRTGIVASSPMIKLAPVGSL